MIQPVDCLIIDNHRTLTELIARLPNISGRHSILDHGDRVYGFRQSLADVGRGDRSSY